ncbi:helix-turn-helix domain-containing protein [Arthrobacter glacialis]|uniref:helix-turn-helix domain-containing protein n=1 Tax=Arthrobacter glacialis TaxID=1664 RepID=UPI000CD3BED0|nr:helix-turn-helix domain-containing protein [Arthrobacter glacialis]POH58887.1 hypothetical protein CVS28_09265 [Arthrobacter glacialis]
MHKTDHELVTTSQAAELSGKGYRTVIRLVERGKLTPAKKLPGIRGAFLFNREDIIALAAPDTSHGQATA